MGVVNLIRLRILISANASQATLEATVVFTMNAMIPSAITKGPVNQLMMNTNYSSFTNVIVEMDLVALIVQQK